MNVRKRVRDREMVTAFGMYLHCVCVCVWQKLSLFLKIRLFMDANTMPLNFEIHDADRECDRECDRERKQENDCE